MGRMDLTSTFIQYTGLPLFRASSENLDSRLENLRTLLTSYSPPISELFLNRGVKAQLGQFLSPMAGRGIASDTISYQPLLIGERKPI